MNKQIKSVTPKQAMTMIRTVRNGKAVGTIRQWMYIAIEKDLRYKLLEALFNLERAQLNHEIKRLNSLATEHQTKHSAEG